jgi:hypothetical protein
MELQNKIFKTHYQGLEIFRELNTKKGKTLVFCDIKELMEIAWDEDLIMDNPHKEDFEAQCPYCINGMHPVDKPYYKYKLYIDKENHTGHCFRCDRIFINISETLNLYKLLLRQ